MKVRKLVGPVVMLCLALAACEDKSETEEAPAAPAEAKPAEPAPPPKPPEPPQPSPQEVCGAVTNAAKAKDEAKLGTLVSKSSTEALAAEGAKEHLLAALGTALCGAAKVEGENATVPLTGGETPQEATFVKQADGWKFDAGAYLAKYPAPEKEKPGKGKKGKDHGKGKAKGKHKKK